MAGKPRPASAHPGQKRPRDRIIFWVDESKRTPLLINQVPAKSRRTHLSTEVKNTYNTHKACRKGHVPLRQIKYQTEELDSIRRELSKIKAQVDSLLKSLESMEQETDQHVGQVLEGVPRPRSPWVPVIPAPEDTRALGFFCSCPSLTGGLLYLHWT
ncbi:uncharacterized protein Gm38523 isoform X2 [Mus musculus]|uniref:uncharacterized protein Gm38523 isoform X2 n=1 Tax=Mus musculus TaxID=10090 RepID=UPI0005ABA542|nr:uncharacterized protein Gm38523 isoform X2 [Mus musculus]|eukprot:XP_011246874.1 PREDICTED: uncharacterized protein Gm38523 isoform X2 [Mus musculus]